LYNIFTDYFLKEVFLAKLVIRIEKLVCAVLAIYAEVFFDEPAFFDERVADIG
jgi:hypothetical protein